MLQALQGLQEPLETQVLLDLQAIQDTRVIQALRALQALLVAQEPLEILEPQVQQALLEAQARQEQQEQVTQE